MQFIYWRLFLKISWIYSYASVFLDPKKKKKKTEFKSG